MNMKKLKSYLGHWPWDLRSSLLAVGIALIPISISLFKERTPTEPSAEPSRANSRSVDTHIPKGFVLVPIDIVNNEALDSLLGKFGIVDLYSKGSESDSNHLVARNVRMLRAPNNPTQFAVLVHEQETNQLLRLGNQFTVIVKRPQNGETAFIEPLSKQHRKIIYGD